MSASSGGWRPIAITTWTRSSVRRSPPIAAWRRGGPSGPRDRRSARPPPSAPDRRGAAPMADAILLVGDDRFEGDYIARVLRARAMVVSGPLAEPSDAVAALALGGIGAAVIGA